MKIAYIVPYVPNLIRTRPYNLISQLADLGHEVSVFTLGSGIQDFDDAESLRLKGARVYYQEHTIWRSLWNIVRAMPSRRPLQTVYSWNPHLAKQLGSLLSVPGTFDLVHVEHLRGSYYGQYVKSRFGKVPVVWDSVDCISHLFKQASEHNSGGFGKFVTRFELPRTQYMEGKLVGEFDQVFVTSAMDKNALMELTSQDSKPAPISVLSNGVDLEYFHPNPNVKKDRETLVFSGKMSYHANIAMVKYLVDEIMPGVWMKRPNLRLIVVGKDPSPDVRALGADPRVMITGTVDDIRPYLWKAACAVVPLVYGAGIQNKILEAMACGTAVVTTSKTTSSLHAIPGRDLLVADHAQEFSQKIMMLLEDQELQMSMGAAGAIYVKNYHNWTVITNQLLLHYSDVRQRMHGTVQR
ncbi:MAG TPA: hypothetical protein DCX53_01800 [Anaerolineae bacterium]|nr:hypothetical protein [Anaerolineae bacterium]